ncbi:MAG TPA: thiamine diphosphokinase [Candidatus Limnocylindrales bacterium]|nr:thiamine diphosphokinase [Candidatus Limnocylindrales bacterium]
MTPATSGHALVLADGSVPAVAQLDEMWLGWSDGLDLVIAADGGARHAAGLGRPIDLWVGDGDSLGEDEITALAVAGIPIRRSPVDKDESDTELAVLAALDAGARRVTILGALGGERVDHGLANVWLLGHPRLAGCDVRLIDATVRIRLVGPGLADLGGRIGDLVSLLPFGGDAAGLTTEGLRYPLRDEPLPSGPSRGLSNVRDASQASLAVGSGRILVLETPATLSR